MTSSLKFHSKVPLTPDGESWAEIDISVPDIGRTSKDTQEFALRAMSMFHDIALPGWRGPVRQAMSELGGQGGTHVPAVKHEWGGAPADDLHLGTGGTT